MMISDSISSPIRLYSFFSLPAFFLQLCDLLLGFLLLFLFLISLSQCVLSSLAQPFFLVHRHHCCISFLSSLIALPCTFVARLSGKNKLRLQLCALKSQLLFFSIQLLKSH